LHVGVLGTGGLFLELRDVLAVLLDHAVHVFAVKLLARELGEAILLGLIFASRSVGRVTPFLLARSFSSSLALL
jgi:hypothetical protein